MTGCKSTLKVIREVTAQSADESWCEWVFDLCVLFLVLLARALDPVWPGGMDYIKVNVILFCVLLPIILFGSLALNIVLLLR
ncbi:MAG: hypothetical protein WCS65_11720 [Verrucomicrobiae bacterium]